MLNDLLLTEHDITQNKKTPGLFLKYSFNFSPHDTNVKAEHLKP